MGLKRFASTLLALTLLASLGACKGDPETEELAKYVQKDLFAIRTYARAANDQYKATLSKNELATSTQLRTKVIPQYNKYIEKLKGIDASTGFVDRLNEEGIQSVTEAVKQLDNYRRVMMKRDSHLTMRARMDAEMAMQKIEQWQNKVAEEARARQITLPGDKVR